MLASPEMMSQSSPIARLLGPRGLMPNPRLNTIVKHDELLEALERQSSGWVSERDHSDQKSYWIMLGN